MLALWKKHYDQPGQHIKKQRHYLANKDLFSQNYCFSIAMVIYGCESWTIKKAEHWRTECFWTVVLEKTVESPLDCKVIQPVNPKGDQPWIFIRRIDAEAETAILWPPDAKNWLTEKDSDAGKDLRQEKWATEDEIVEWHHQLDRYEFG